MPEVSHPLSTEEELFCMRYELEILSGIINHNRLERWVPGFCGPHTQKEHELRYEWAKDFVKNKTVLDIACGAGFGTYRLVKDGAAAKVTGWDNDEKTIRYASLRNRHPQLIFAVQDAETFDMDKEFDVIISFETIEHLKKPGLFLNKINQALTNDGLCFISTPISNQEENSRPDNSYHEQEWGFRRFRELVKAHLRIEDIYLQLYSGQAFTTGFFSKLLKKTGWKRNEWANTVEKLIPCKWDSGELKEELIGTAWTGYQILQCRKKTDVAD